MPGIRKPRKSRGTSGLQNPRDRLPVRREPDLDVHGLHAFAGADNEPERAAPARSKCGAIKKSGKRSCCAGDGAWYNNCGDPGDSKFDYTWFEGIQACKGSARSFQAKYRQPVSRAYSTIAHLPSVAAVLPF